jgi:hypothetical protein
VTAARLRLRATGCTLSKHGPQRRRMVSIRCADRAQEPAGPAIDADSTRRAVRRGGCRWSAAGRLFGRFLGARQRGWKPLGKGVLAREGWRFESSPPRSTPLTGPYSVKWFLVAYITHRRLLDGRTHWAPNGSQPGRRSRPNQPWVEPARGRLDARHRFTHCVDRRRLGSDARSGGWSYPTLGPGHRQYGRHDRSA